MVKNCGFVMGFIILAIHFRLKTTIFKNLIAFKTKTNMVRYYHFFIIGYINHCQTYAIFSEFFNGFSLAWYSTLI